MQALVIVVAVAIGYAALALLSAAIAYSPEDAWTVWLASGLLLGLLLCTARSRWAPILGGGFVGATAFAFWLGSGPLEALGYGAIEVLAAGVAAFAATRIVSPPIRLHSARDLVAVVIGGALPLALVGALLATAWHVAAGGGSSTATFRVWALSNFIGTLLVAPLVIAWAGFRLRRSGGLTMPAFVAGAIAGALFLGTLWLLFDAPHEERFVGSTGQTLTYVPIVFMALTALLWGVRGATLIAFLGALVAMVNTAQGDGPFAGVEGLLGEAELEVQGYAVALALTGLLIAVLAAGQRNAMRAARDWQTRFEAAIGAHRMLAYEWDPVSGRMVVTGDAAALVGVPPAALASRADWLTRVAPEDRARVDAQFDARTYLNGSDAIDYRLAGPGGAWLDAHDEARAIRDHDGTLHRVAGIVRIAGPAPQGDSR